MTLSERTAESGLTSMHSPDELAVPGLRERMISGLAVGDFNNDGYQDLFCLTGGDLPDRLFINNGNGTFTDRAAEWGLAELHCGSGVSAGGVSADGSPTGKRWRMTTTTERMTTKTTTTIRDNDLRQQQWPRRYPANHVREGAYSLSERHWDQDGVIGITDFLGLLGVWG